MVKGLYTAYTGMINQMNRLDTLTNNLANADTNGFKKEGATAQSFDDLYALKIKDTSNYGMTKNLGQISLGVKIGENYTDYSQGSLRETGNSTDLAIAGDGFFAISFTDKAGNNSVKYTRDGAFTLDKEGYLRTKDGDYVLNLDGALNSDPGEDNYIQVDPTQTISINEQGDVVQNGVEVGQVGLVDVENYDYISKYGENMSELEEGGAITQSDATMIQGSLEMSNVNVVTEMVDMITVTRAYESNQKVISTIDGTLDKAVNQLGRV